MQLAAGRPGEFGDAALDGGVDVLVGLDEDERVAFHLVGDLVERRQDVSRSSSADSSPTRARPRTWAREPAMSSRHMLRSNGRLTV